MKNYKDKKVLILGLGLNDGGVGAAKFFAKALFKTVEPFTTLGLERDNKAYFEKYGFFVSKI